MPGGNRKKKKSGRPSHVPVSAPKPIKASTSTNSGTEETEPDDVTAEARFEKELSWCVEQLELGLANRNPSRKQAEDAIKVLHILKNPKASLIRKRQLMRNTFGDYRSKMAQEQKHALAEAKRKMKVNPVESKLMQNSVFYKRSRTQAPEAASAPSFTMTQSDNSFRFSFQDPAPAEDMGMETNASTKDEDTQPFNYEPTKSPFKFNFGLQSKSGKDDHTNSTVSSETAGSVLKSETEDSLDPQGSESCHRPNGKVAVDSTETVTSSIGDMHIAPSGVETALIDSKTTETERPKDLSQDASTDTSYCQINLGGSDFKFNFQTNDNNS